MTSLPLLVIANDGPLSPVLVHLASIMRADPFASQGAVKEPGPVDPGGQSCGGSAAADADGATLADGAGAETDGAATALADAEGEPAPPEDASSFEQAGRTTADDASATRSVLSMARCYAGTIMCARQYWKVPPNTVPAGFCEYVQGEPQLPMEGPPFWPTTVRVFTPA